jgi:hypothetical protein
VKTLLTVLFFCGFSASAAEVSLANLGSWRMTALNPKNEILTGNAQVMLTLPGSAYIPTVLMESIPAEATPATSEEWRQLLNVNGKEVKEQLTNSRYIVEYKRDIGGDVALHILQMAEIVGGRVYLLTFQNHPKTFADHAGKVRRMFERIRIIDTRNRRI